MQSSPCRVSITPFTLDPYHGSSADWVRTTSTVNKCVPRCTGQARYDWVWHADAVRHSSIPEPITCGVWHQEADWLLGSCLLLACARAILTLSILDRENNSCGVTKRHRCWLKCGEKTVFRLSSKDASEMLKCLPKLQVQWKRLGMNALWTSVGTNQKAERGIPKNYWQTW